MHKSSVMPSSRTASYTFINSLWTLATALTALCFSWKLLVFSKQYGAPSLWVITITEAFSDTLTQSVDLGHNSFLNKPSKYNLLEQACMVWGTPVNSELPPTGQRQWTKQHQWTAKVSSPESRAMGPSAAPQGDQWGSCQSCEQAAEICMIFNRHINPVLIK